MFGTKAPVRAQGSCLFDLGLLLTGRRDLNEAAIRALCANAYLGNETALCRVLGRYKMFVDTQDVGLTSHLLLEGFWEMWVTEAMLRHVESGMTALDVGANLGYFSVLLAELVGPSGRVHAFEPNSAIASRLRKTLSVNGFAGRTDVHEVALGNEDRDVAFIIPENEPKNAFIAPGTETTAVNAVPMRRLDGYDLGKVDFIKIDVEGAEEGLWEGMHGILDRGAPLTIFLEFTPGRYHDPASFLERILSHGFALSRVEFVGGVMSVNREQVLSEPSGEDQMLVLTR